MAIVKELEPTVPPAARIPDLALGIRPLEERQLRRHLTLGS